MTYKFIFFGTPYVARDTLLKLIEHGWRPEVVITNPDAPRGRKQVMTASETKAAAEANGIPVFTPERLDDEFVESLKQYACDFAIVVAYGKILPETLINAFPKGVLNIHYSLLPKYRGASPVEAALLNDDRDTGVTIQKMVHKLDAGDIVAVKTEAVLPDDTVITLRERLITLGSDLLVDALPKYLDGEIQPTKQNEAEVTFASKIKKEDGEIKLEDDASVNWNKYRAYAAWPGVFFMKNGKRIKITKAEMDADEHFKILRVIQEGKKEMDYEVWLGS